MAEEREHIASVDCWCGPVVEAYGSTVAVDDDPEDEDG